MDISARYLRLVLRKVFNDCKVGKELKLRDALEAAAIESLEMLTNGSISSNSSAGHSTMFSGFGAGKLTALEVAEAWEFLVEQFDLAVSELSGAPTDEQVYNQMHANLAPIVGTTSNFMYLSK